MVQTQAVPSSRSVEVIGVELLRRMVTNGIPCKAVFNQTGADFIPQSKHIQHDSVCHQHRCYTDREGGGCNAMAATVGRNENGKVEFRIRAHGNDFNAAMATRCVEALLQSQELATLMEGMKFYFQAEELVIRRVVAQ